MSSVEIFTQYAKGISDIFLMVVFKTSELYEKIQFLFIKPPNDKLVETILAHSH